MKSTYNCPKCGIIQAGNKTTLCPICRVLIEVANEIFGDKLIAINKRNWKTESGLFEVIVSGSTRLIEFECFKDLQPVLETSYTDDNNLSIIVGL